MVLPGHLAAGYITARALIAIVHPAISSTELQLLTLFGTLSGDFPDIDVVYHMLKRKTTSPKDLGDHRHYVTHAPIVWLALGLLVFVFNTTTFFKMIGLLLWLGPWSHFLGDSIDFGVMWLWPFSKKRYALLKWSVKDSAPNTSWPVLFKKYLHRATCYVEITLVIIAIGLFFR